MYSKNKHLNLTTSQESQIMINLNKLIQFSQKPNTEYSSPSVTLARRTIRTKYHENNILPSNSNPKLKNRINKNCQKTVQTRNTEHTRISNSLQSQYSSKPDPNYRKTHECKKNQTKGAKTNQTEQSNRSNTEFSKPNEINR